GWMPGARPPECVVLVRRREAILVDADGEHAETRVECRQGYVPEADALKDGEHPLERVIPDVGVPPCARAVDSVRNGDVHRKTVGVPYVRGVQRLHAVRLRWQGCERRAVLLARVLSNAEQLTVHVPLVA